MYIIILMEANMGMHMIESGIFGWFYKRFIFRTRLSMEDPNFKNLPKKEQEKIISEKIKFSERHPIISS